MDRKTTTVEDVATLAGVSRGTVDRVLHNRPGVSAKNLIRVRKAIEELGYEPNVYASSLASKKERVIALLMPDYNKGEYWEKMYQGFSEACKKNVNLKIRGVHYNYDSNDPESFQRACDAILEDEPSGVVLSPFFLDDMLLFTKSLNTLKAIAGSVVVPLFEMTFTQMSLPSHRATISLRLEGLIELPIK